MITTATDAHGIFAVDEWAKHQNCTVLEAERIKHVSSKLLAGQSVRFAAEFPVQGTLPAGVDPARTPAEADFTPLACSLPGDSIWCPASGCWASAAAGGRVPSSWKPPLRTSVPGTAVPRRASQRRPAST